MTGARERYLVWIGEWLLAFAFVVGAGLLSKLFTRNAAGVSSIWLANGILLGFLLHAPRQRWPGLLAACALGQLASSVLAQDPMRSVFAATLINTAEVFIAALPLRNRIATARDLSLAGNFVPFLGVVLLAPLASGLALLGWLSFTGSVSASVLGSWYVGHALGMATSAPVMLALRGDALARLFRGEHRLEAALTTLLIVMVTGAVFWQSTYALHYLIFPPMLLAALRGGFAGTAFALILVTGIAAVLTGLGRGPLVPMDNTGGYGAFLLLQVFIAVLLLTCFPVAVGMAAWRRNQRTERKLRTLLGLLVEHSSDVTVLTDLDGRRVFVSPSVREVLGWEPAEFLKGSFRDLVHASHYEEMERQLEQLRQAHGGKVTITFPTHRKDGRGIWLEARVRHFRDADFLERDDGHARQARKPGDEEGFVVTLRNVTRRRQTEQALEEANRKLSSLVHKDSLTGLGNRRYFDQLLAAFWQHCEREQVPMAVILLDIDYFKGYNDHYGHQQGDHCLREVARSIAGSVRDARESAARYGGEEFAVLLADAGAADAAGVAERIRRDIERLAMPHAGSPFGHVTVSIGVASIDPDSGSSTEDLVKAADRSLYQSKTRGRNRVTAGEARESGLGEAGG
jgi:diguanylate cyclase (GGDEF)-like protein/PAS domain S-box-containing protein